MRVLRVAGSSLLLSLLTLAATPGCKGKEKEDPHSLAKMEAEGPPHTPNCKSWDELDFDAQPALPEGAHVKAFDEVWRTIAEKHYDPTLACLDWPAIREQYAAKVVAAGEDTAAAYAAINEMLGLLGQSHLHATPPTLSTTRKRETGPATVPIAVRWLPLEAGGSERGAVVVDASVDGHESSLPLGAVLTEVAGESVSEVADDAQAAIADRDARPTEVAFTVARAIGAMLSCPEGGSKTIAYLDASDQTQQAEVPCFVPEGERVSLGNLRNLPTSVESRMIGDPEQPPGPDEPPPPVEQPAIGYVAFNYWMLPMTEQIRTDVAELRSRGMKALIIDLRGNPGGVGAMSIPVARLFSASTMTLGRLQMREFDQEFKVEANPDPFTGPLVILVDEGTASTSEIFAVGMRDAGRAEIVGAGPSAGMALPSMIDTLSDGGMIQYVVGDYHSSKGTVAEGDGVKPDVEVAESRADYVGGHDPVLEAAVAHLRSRLEENESP
jgi:carboxyl-terminal processing protease